MTLPDTEECKMPENNKWVFKTTLIFRNERGFMDMLWCHVNDECYHF